MTTATGSEYLAFVEEPGKQGRRIVAVRAKSTGQELGGITWYGRWRQYTFIPNPATLWSQDCLDDIAAFIRSMTP